MFEGGSEMNMGRLVLVVLVGLLLVPPCVVCAAEESGGKGWQPISTEELQALQKGKTKIHLVDVLPGILHDVEHIPGSINIPFGLLRSSQKLPRDKNALLVFYCMGVLCMYSPQAADLAHELGYKNIRVYREGLIGWQRAGLPVVSKVTYPEVDVPRVSAPAAAEATDVLLLDIRPADNFDKGHAKGSINIDLEVLGERLNSLPRDKHIVLIDHKGKLTLTAGRFLIWKGVTNVSRMDGGFNGWVKSGLPVNQPADARQERAQEIARP
jgi:rhodanese-related sulfurtransferase